MRFDFEVYEKYKEERGRKNFTIILKDGTRVAYSADEDGYRKVTRVGPRLIYDRFYYKSGLLKQERTTFYHTSVDAFRSYDETGKLVLEKIYTPPDWVERLTTKVKQETGLDMISTKHQGLFVTIYL